MTRGNALVFATATTALLTAGCSLNPQISANREMQRENWAASHSDATKALNQDLAAVAAANNIPIGSYKVAVDPNEGVNGQPQLSAVGRSNNVNHIILNHEIEHPPFNEDDRKALIAIAINNTQHPVQTASYPAALEQAMKDQLADKTDTSKIPAAAADEASHNVGLANLAFQTAQDKSTAEMLGVDGTEKLKHALASFSIASVREHFPPEQTPTYAQRIDALKDNISPMQIKGHAR